MFPFFKSSPYFAGECSLRFTVTVLDGYIYILPQQISDQRHINGRRGNHHLYHEERDALTSRTVPILCILLFSPVEEGSWPSFNVWIRAPMANLLPFIFQLPPTKNFRELAITLSLEELNLWVRQDKQTSPLHKSAINSKASRQQWEIDNRDRHMYVSLQHVQVDRIAKQ